MISPGLTFGVILATLYGACAHLLLGGDGRRLLFNILAAALGFGLGQAAGQVMSIHALSIGPINLLAGTLGSWIALGALALLSRSQGKSSLP